MPRICFAVLHRCSAWADVTVPVHRQQCGGCPPTWLLMHCRAASAEWRPSDTLVATHADAGSSVVGGLQLGNVWVGVQPALGLEGDPMRLLFERDLTPHPQYAAFYLWLQRGLRADAVCHLGACACTQA